MRLIGFVLVLTLGLTLAPLAGEAQQADKMPLVGILDGGVPHLFTAFREACASWGMSRVKTSGSQ
jgi:hypothetical protein